MITTKEDDIWLEVLEKAIKLTCVLCFLSVFSCFEIVFMVELYMKLTSFIVNYNAFLMLHDYPHKNT